MFSIENLRFLPLLKCALLFFTCQLIAFKSFSQTDTAVKLHNLEEVDFHYRKEKRHSKNVNVNKRSMHEKVRFGMRYRNDDSFSRQSLTQEIRLNANASDRKAVIRKIKCKLDQYDTMVFSMFIVFKTVEKDTIVEYYCLNSAKWNDGWAELDFEKLRNPNLKADQPFYLGYASKVTNPKYQFVNFELYQDNLLSRKFSVQRYEKSVEQHLAKVEVASERPPCKYPFKIQYSYSEAASK